jgi:hypothetical protein
LRILESGLTKVTLGAQRLLTCLQSDANNTRGAIAGGGVQNRLPRQATLQSIR